MGTKGDFPSPEEVSFMLIDCKRGIAMPLDSLPQKEWERLRGDILFHIGRGLFQFYLSGEGQ